MASEVQADPSERHSVRVQEFYSDYEPPFDVRALVTKLIDAVPPKYLHQLDCVVLTNHNALSYDLRRGTTKSRKRKVKLSEALGLYHQEWDGKPAWIEIFVDRIVRANNEAWLWRIPIFRSLVIAQVVYHELGHHVHKTRRPEFREREDVADDWSKEFTSAYLRREYAYLRPLLPVVRLVVSLGQFAGMLPKSDKA